MKPKRTFTLGDPEQLGLDGMPVNAGSGAQGALFDPPAPAPDATIGACPTCGASVRFVADDHRCERCREIGVKPGELIVDEREAHRAQCPGALMRPVIGPQTPVCNVCDWSPGQPLPDREEG